jgi:hypothetical protein
MASARSSPRWTLCPPSSWLRFRYAGRLRPDDASWLNGIHSNREELCNPTRLVVEPIHGSQSTLFTPWCRRTASSGGVRGRSHRFLWYRDPGSLN